MRVFLAIEIPEGVKEELVGVQRDLESQLPGVRWESPQKLHITLVFLGKVENERVAELEAAVRKACLPCLAGRQAAGRGVKGLKGINVGFCGVGAFPPRRSRVVLVEIGEGREEIEKLQKRLAEALSEAGFEFAKLSRPHVTLGRFRRGTDATRRVSWDSTLRVGDFWVKDLVIVESKLHPAGAIHTPLARIPLGERGKRREPGA